MLPLHIDQLLREKLQTDFKIKGVNIRDLKRKAAEKAVQKGAVGIPGFYASEFALEIKNRAKIIADTIIEVLTVVKMKPYPDLISDLTNFYKTEFGYTVAHWEQNIKESLKELPISNEDSFYHKLQADIEAWEEEHIMNIKLFGAGIMEPSLEKGNTTIIIQSSAVGILNTANGTVNAESIAITQNDYKPVLEALQFVKDELHNLQTIDAVKRSELDEVINDVLNEINKPQPNKSRLCGLLTTILIVIKGCEILEKAYTPILHFLHMLGLDVTSLPSN